MSNYFNIEVKKCIDDFYLFYNTDKYITKKELDLFFKKYTSVFELINKYEVSLEDQDKIQNLSSNGYKMIEIKNTKYVKDKLNEYKDYFDNLFLEVDKNIVLDKEQRTSILIDEDYSLIIAGAGSGKTTTMAAKVKFLIEKKGINPNKIILLSFTKKATEELKDLVNNKFKLNVEVSTFHALGMKFLRKIYPFSFQIITDKGIYAVLTQYFKEIVFKNKNVLKHYVDGFSKKINLEDFCYQFNTYEQYYEHYKQFKYNEHKYNLKEEITKRKENRAKYYKTINGEYVKSLGEVIIANYLYENNINYKYEKRYSKTVEDNKIYNPDFTIIDSDTELYVEYFGIASIKKDGTIYSYDKNYIEEIYRKRKTHKLNNTELIELYGHYDDSNAFKELKKELEKRHLINFKRNDKDVFNRLLDTSVDTPYMNLIKLMQLFIQLFKELGYEEKDFDYLVNECTEDTIKKQIILVKHAYKYYQNYLKKEMKIDFQDMISHAYKDMSIIKNTLNNIDYDYVVIDEYQDISVQRYNFAKKVSDVFNAKIVAVGDDWQSIYAFSGSNVDLFTKFYDMMGYASVTQITKTYRNSQQLIDLAGEFILKNETQIVKRLISDKDLPKPVEYVYYNYDEEINTLSSATEAIIKHLYQNNKNDRILLLGRFNDEIDILLASRKFYKKNKTQDIIICSSCPNAQIDFLTVHKSKGLGYDQVIILNALNEHKGFPSQIKDEELIRYLKIISETEGGYLEERRLFYVALTRTKNKVYIMTPYLETKKSDFVKEIKEHDSVYS